MNAILGEGSSGIIYEEYHDKYGPVAVKRYKNEKHMYNEVKILRAVKQLITKNVCPNFAYMYSTNISTRPSTIISTRPSTIISTKTHLKNAYIMQRKYDINLQDFIKTWHPLRVFKSILFQILMGMLVFQTYLSGSHRDLLGNNIFIKYVNKDENYCYNVNSTNYFIKTYGYQAVIADFGVSVIGKPIRYTDFRYLARLPGILSYYNDANNGRAIAKKYHNMIENNERDDVLDEEHAIKIKTIIYKLRKNDDKRLVSRKLYLYLYYYTKYIPKLNQKTMQMILNLQRIIDDIGLKPDTLLLTTLNFSSFANKCGNKNEQEHDHNYFIKYET
jgi:hypothetical protein